jgi:ABC-type uncharacterized transport system substrate-binding protein
MKRREFITLIGGAATWPLAARAQPGEKKHRIGLLIAAPPETIPELLDSFRDGLRERGYVAGQNLTIVVRSLGTSGQDPAAAAELVRGNVDVILAWTTPVVLAAQRATRTLPIVLVGVADPVGLGVVASLARPGGNVTGISNVSSDLSAKIVELVREVSPACRRVGVIRNPYNVGGTLQLRQTEGALRALALDFEVVDAGTLPEFEKAFAHLTSARVDAVVLLADPSLVEHGRAIAELAQRAKLPTFFQRRENIDAGGLLSYGPNLKDQFRQAAGHVDRILKGEKPADLPVQQPTKFELVINLRTAKALGLEIPLSLLARADEVIE